MAEKKPTPNKKGATLWSYILPYLIMAIAIIFFVVLIFGNTKDTNSFVVQQNDIEAFVISSYEKDAVDHESTFTFEYKDSKGDKYEVENYRIVYVETTTTTAVTYLEGKVALVDSHGELLTEGKNYVTVPFSAKIDREFYNSVVMKPLSELELEGGQLIVDAYKTSWWDQWGPTIILMGISTILVIWLFSRMSSSVNSSNRSAMDYNKSRARMVTESKTRFSDVAGADAEKAELVEIVDYLKNSKKYSKFGAKIPKGILLVGPPGTGKTLLAKAAAGEAGVPFFSISGSDFVEMFVGVGAGRVRDMFKQAKKNAPCIIFIDELDAVGRQRGAGMGGGNDEREQTLNQLLVEMDGFEENIGIIVMAATNREDVLDPALLRAGRFDRKIIVDLPDRLGREAIFKVHARGKTLSPHISFGQLAKRTTGFSGADIASIMNDAAILAIRRNGTMITTADIDEAIDRRLVGPARASTGMSEHERKVVAYHESGHAVIGLNLEHSDKVRKITIIPRGRTGGHVMMTPEDDRFLMTRNELVAKIVGYLGGRTSEEIFFNDISTGASNDIEMATQIARSMVTEYGMSHLGPIQYEKDSGSVFLGRDYTSSQKNFSSEIAVEIDKAIRQIIEEAHEKAREVLTTHKDDVILIAETLLEKETITDEEISYLLEHRKLPPNEEELNTAEKEEQAVNEKAAKENPTEVEVVEKKEGTEE